MQQVLVETEGHETAPNCHIIIIIVITKPEKRTQETRKSS